MSSSFKNVLAGLGVSLIFTLGYIYGRVAERKQFDLKREYQVVFRETAHGNYYIDLIPVKEDEK